MGVVRNHAVHPGVIDLRDDKATALQLFGHVNLITQAMTTVPKQVHKTYQALSEAVRNQIEKRDGQG